MKRTSAPLARSRRLLVQTVGNEAVVYDEKTQRLHRLNPAAAAIWRNCDGSRNLTELTRAARTELKAKDLTEAAVLKSLREMAKTGLLESAPTLRQLAEQTTARPRQGAPKRGKRVSRPVVATFLAPTPMMAGSCVANGNACTTNAQCCSTVCCGTTCVPDANSC